MTDKLSLWYVDGLAFECTGCGGCCTGEPGYTWVSTDEITKIAAYLQLTVDQFSRRYLRRVGNRYALTELRPHNDCVFLENGKRCKIYPVRPTQCRTFPFWPESVQTPDAWRETARRCEGIRDGAPVVAVEDIERQRETQLAAERGEDTAHGGDQTAL